VPIDQGLAHLSDTLFTTAIAIYSGALVSYCGEYAFGRRGRIAETSVAYAAERELVAAAATAVPVLAGSPRLTELPAEAGSSTTGSSTTGPVSADAPPASPADPASTGPVSADPAAADAGSDGGSRGDRLGRLAVGLTLLGLLVHAGSVVLRGVAAGRVPWGNMYEFSSAVGVVAVVAFLVVLARQPQLRYLGMFVMLPVIILMFLAGTVLYTKAAPLVAALRSYWLAIHVTAAVLATGIFMVSFVATALYLVRARWDRMVAAGRQPTRFPATLGWRLPEAEVLDRVAYRTVAFGFPIWTFGIIAGAIWAEAAWSRYWGWDPKETWAFIAWVIYACYLHARATAGWRGSKAAWINVLAFSAMIFNFFIVNIVISGLHSYAGLS
jgi:cytochrome c-type biogenesis protein CcsB